MLARAHYLQAAEARLADMEGLLDALFAYARATDAASDLDRRPLVVLPVLADVLTGQFPAFEERGWEPAVDFPDESLVVEADSEALARMFENLVSNALRYGASAPSIVQRGRSLTFFQQGSRPDGYRRQPSLRALLPRRCRSRPRRRRPGPCRGGQPRYRPEHRG